MCRPVPVAHQSRWIELRQGGRIATGADGVCRHWYETVAFLHALRVGLPVDYHSADHFPLLPTAKGRRMDEWASSSPTILQALRRWEGPRARSMHKLVLIPPGQLLRTGPDGLSSNQAAPLCDVAVWVWWAGKGYLYAGKCHNQREFARYMRGGGGFTLARPFARPHQATHSSLDLSSPDRLCLSFLT